MNCLRSKAWTCAKKCRPGQFVYFTACPPVLRSVAGSGPVCYSLSICCIENFVAALTNHGLYKRWALSMEKAPTFIDRSSWNSNLRNTSGRPPHMPNFVKIGLRGWAGRTPSLPQFWFYLLFFFVCVFFALRPGHTAGPITTHDGS